MNSSLKKILLCIQMAMLLGCTNICMTKHDNPMPDLFHPQSALARMRLKEVSSQQLTHPAIKLNNKFVKDGSDIVVTVTDKSCAEGKSPELSITGGRPVGQTISNGNSASLTVDAKSLDGDYVTLEYSSCSQAGKIRKKFPIYKTPLRIEGPKGNYLLKNQKYALSIYDVCAAGAPSLQVSFDPPDAGAIGKREGDYWNYEIDTNKTSIVEGAYVRVTVRSCRGLNLSPDKALEVGLLKDATYQVVKSSFRDISAKLVIWPYENVINEFGKAFADTFHAADIVFVNPNPKSLLVYGSSLTANIRFSPSRKSVENAYTNVVIENPSLLFIPDEDGNILADRMNWKESWRPLSFSDVLAIFSYQQESNPRKRGMEWLKSLGVLLTGASIFTPGIDYTRGVAFFTGVFNPALEKQLLWDMLLHLKNVEARALKEIEEITPNGQLRKAVFFPRDAIYGIIPEMPVYISEIRPDPASVTVTVIDKEATVESKKTGE